MGHDPEIHEEPTDEDAELYVRIFEPKKRETRMGSSRPSPQLIAQYYCELESIAAAYQHAEAHSAGLLVG